MEERERGEGDQGDYDEPSAQSLKTRVPRLTVHRLRDEPVQRQQRVLDVFILQRSLEVRLVQSGLSEGLDDDDRV